MSPNTFICQLNLTSLPTRKAPPGLGRNVSGSFGRFLCQVSILNETSNVHVCIPIEHKMKMHMPTKQTQSHRQSQKSPLQHVFGARSNQLRPECKDYRSYISELQNNLGSLRRRLAGQRASSFLAKYLVTTSCAWALQLDTITLICQVASSSLARICHTAEKTTSTVLF